RRAPGHRVEAVLRDLRPPLLERGRMAVVAVHAAGHPGSPRVTFPNGRGPLLTLFLVAQPESVGPERPPPPPASPPGDGTRAPGAGSVAAGLCRRCWGAVAGGVAGGVGPEVRG